jgi:hypothetical protein
VILAGCKAEHFILESSSDKNGRSKKCVGLVTTCVSNDINKKLCTIIVTLALLFGTFASLVLWESGRNGAMPVHCARVRAGQRPHREDHGRRGPRALHSKPRRHRRSSASACTARCTSS